MNQKCLKMNNLTTPNLAVKNRTHILVYTILILKSSAKRAIHKYTLVSKFPLGGVG